MSDGSRAIAPWSIASKENYPLEDSPLTIKFPSTIIAPTQVNPPKEWTEENYALPMKDIRVLQLRRKKWFTSIYFLQILAKPCRTPLKRAPFTKCLLIFFGQNEKKKKQFLEKLIRKKIQKNFILNSNNKIIRAWYLREALGEYTYLPKKTGSFPVKIVRN